MAGRDTQVSLNNQGEPQVHQYRSLIRPLVELTNATGHLPEFSASDGTGWNVIHTGMPNTAAPMFQALLVALQNQVAQIARPTQDPIPSEAAEEDINLLEEVYEDNH